MLKKATKIEKHVNVRPIRHLLYSFEDEFGRDELRSVIESIGLPLEYFEDEKNWITGDHYLLLLEKFKHYTGDSRIAFKYGLNTIKYLKGWGVIIKVISSMATPSVLFKRVVQNIHRWGKTATLKLRELKESRAEIELTINDGFRFNKNMCLHIQGQMASIPTLWGLPYAKVTELQCISQGADSCIYRFTWNEKIQRQASYRGLFWGVLLFIASYILYVFKIINAEFLTYLFLVFIPLSAFFSGLLLSYKRNHFDTISNMEEQDAALLDSLLTRQTLSDDLQEKIDERVRSLKKVNDQLQRTIDDLEVTKEQVIRSEKTAAIGSLAAGMAHELNNPIGAIRNFIQDVLDDTPDNDPLRKKLEIAEAATGRCKKIVNDLLSYSWEEKDLSLTCVNINETVKISISEAEEIVEGAGITLWFKPGEAIPEIMVDSMLLQQVFMNIIMNSCDAIKGEGEINVQTGCTGKDVFIEISDSGEGIKSEYLDRIFDPYFSTKESGQTRGMGLAISANIIRRMGGDIEVKSTPGKGTVFMVFLPIKGLSCDPDDQ